MSILRKQTISADDSPSIDPFGRWRTSQPFTLFDSKQLIDKSPVYFDEETNGTATSVHSAVDAATTMSVSANNDYVIRQTFMRFNYQPGKGQLVLATGIIGEPVANTVSRIGYFNSATTGDFSSDYDGIYFESDGSDVSVNIAKNGTIDQVNQSAWNLDRLDGSGGVNNPSGINADWDTSHIFFIDFEWLGVGRVRIGVVIDGMIYYVHQFNHANSVTSAYMSSPNHSVRYEIRSTGGTKSMKHICCSVASEGGLEPSGQLTSVDNDDTGVAVANGVLEMLVAFRLKTTHLGETIKISNLSAIAASSGDFRWTLLLNPTIANAVTWTDVTNAGIQQAIGSGSNTITSEGHRLASGYGSSDTDQIALPVETILNIGVGIDGTRDVMALAVEPVGSNETFYGSINLIDIA